MRTFSKLFFLWLIVSLLRFEVCCAFAKMWRVFMLKQVRGKGFVARFFSGNWRLVCKNGVFV